MNGTLDIAASARPAASGNVVLRALLLVGLVVVGLLVGLGVSSSGDAAASRERHAARVGHAALVGSDAVRTSGHSIAPVVADADGWARNPSAVDPLSVVLPPLSGAGFDPRKPGVSPTWTSTPPDRPPRHA